MSIKYCPHEAHRAIRLSMNAVLYIFFSIFDVFTPDQQNIQMICYMFFLRLKENSRRAAPCSLSDMRGNRSIFLFCRMAHKCNCIS